MVKKYEIYSLLFWLAMLFAIPPTLLIAAIMRHSAITMIMAGLFSVYFGGRVHQKFLHRRYSVRDPAVRVFWLTITTMAGIPVLFGIMKLIPPTPLVGAFVLADLSAVLLAWLLTKKVEHCDG